MFNLKKILFVLAFLVAALVIPTIIMLIFVDATSYFHVYLIVYVLILFAAIGYIISTLRSMEKKLDSFFEDIKKQNAAIAYKLTNSSDSTSPVAQSVATAPVKEAPVVDTSKVKLNPDDPLVVTAPKKAPVDDGYDDFK